MAIDRQKLVDTEFPEGSERADFMTPCAIPNGCAGSAWYGYDPLLAKELLTAAGFPDGFATTIHYPDASAGAGAALSVEGVPGSSDSTWVLLSAISVVTRSRVSGPAR